MANLVRVVLQAFPPVRLLQLDLSAVPVNTQDLVIVLGLATFQSRFSPLEFRFESTDIGVGSAAFAAGFLDSGLEISYRSVVVLQVEI